VKNLILSAKEITSVSHEAKETDVKIKDNIIK